MRDDDPRTGDPLFADLRRAYEPDSASLRRVKTRARQRAASRAGLAGRWTPRLAAALVFSVLVAVAVSIQRPSERTTEPTATPATGESEAPPTLTISNEGGFVTVRTDASQWIVLPGDPT